MLSQKINIFVRPFCEATPACLLVMVQGNIWLATIGHFQKALETGFIAGVGVLILSSFACSWFSNKYVVASITGGMCFFADLLVHSAHFGSFTSEAIVTGAITSIISLAVNFVGKKLFVHGRNKITKSQLEMGYSRPWSLLSPATMKHLSRLQLVCHLAILL